MSVMSKKDKFVYSKIEVDEGSSEPKIVDVPLKSIDENFEKNEEIVHEEPSESAGKQIVMNKVLGAIDKNDAIDKKQALFKRNCSILFVVVVVAVLAYTVYQDFFTEHSQPPTWAQVIEIFSRSWMHLVFAFVALFLCYFFKALKLSFLCKVKTKKWHFKTCFGTGIIGHYYNYITPLAVGGQPFEVYHLSKHGVQGGVAAALPIASFFMQQLGFVILGIVSLVLYNKNTLNIPDNMHFISPVFNSMAIIGLVCCFFVPGMVMVFSMFPKLGGSIVYFIISLGHKLKIVKDKDALKEKMTKNILQNSSCLKTFVTNPFIFFVALLISFAENLALCSIAFFTLKFFGYNLVDVTLWRQWAQVCVLCMILYSVISFIPTPGNSGAADLSFRLLFVGCLQGLTTSFGIVSPALLTWRFISFYAFIVIGFIFTKVSKRLEKKKEEQV
jgi:uncharacterized protein (TIRG00374 family)